MIHILIDTVFLMFIAGEASFTGSAGTKYYLGNHDAYGAEFYFVYLLTAAVVTLLIQTCNNKYDPVPLFTYGLSVFFIAQYGTFIDLDYKEANRTSLGWWGTLKNISTLGNTPWDPPDAESVHWAIVEAVVVVLVCINIVHHLSKTTV